ncbi:MAG: phosphoesterase PA-phosphatase [Methanobacterium sp. BRmetb2]|jgi:membrane-associated phospholipid phosphatase|nr:MAG: phosphoesterase PA-phosphatase [Methanobacterium sp. BRmetb2]
MEYLIRKEYKDYFAELVSLVASAPLVAIPIFILINYVLLDWNDFIFYSILSVFFAAILPSIISIIWIYHKKVEMDMPNKSDRIYPLLMVILSYMVGTVVLYAFKAPSIITVLMFCYLFNTVVVLLINFYWKISIHVMGISGPAPALIYVFGYWGIIFSLIIPLIMWSRYHLKRHTFYQVLAGAGLGFSLTTLQIYLLLFN